MKHPKFQVVAAALLVSAAVPASAEKRQHGTHEHGLAQLSVAVEGLNVQLMLESPMFNLAGFGLAKTEQQDHAVEEIEHLLNDPLALFALSGATCVSVSTTVVGEAFEGEHAMHDEKHDEHADEGHDEHKDEHADEHADEEHDEHKDGHADEGHDEHDEARHADVKVEWVLECSELGENPVMQVKLFEHFEHLKQLDVQYLSGDKQGAEQLTAAQAELQL